MTAPAVLDAINYILVHLVQFRWSVDGVPHELNLNTAGAKVRLDRLHVSKLMAVSDVVADNTGPSRLAAILRITGPHSVRYNDASWLVYPSVSAIIQAFPQIYSTATVKVRIEVTDPHENSEVKEMMTDASVSEVSGCDGMTITFEIEQRDPTELTILPRRTLSKRTVPAAHTRYIDKDTVGTPLPIALGDCLPGLLVDDETSWWRYKLGVLGLTVPTFPTIRSHKYLSGVEWRDVNLWTEKIAGVDLLESDHNSSYVGKALVFNYWKDAAGVDRYGTSVDGAFSSAAGYSAYAHAHESRVRPWVMHPLVPEPVNDDAGEAALAVDGNTLTYATIQPGHYMEFEVTGGGNHGRISRNTTDAGTDANTDDEGAGAPVGLKVLALLVMPPGGVAPGSSQCVLSFAWPNGATYKGATGTFTPPSAGHSLCQVNVPYRVSGVAIGQPTAGWAGTRFATWDFSTHPVSGTAAGAENPNYYADGKQLPMRIRIENNGAAGQGPIYVVATDLAVGCTLNREARAGVSEPDVNKLDYMHIMSSAHREHLRRAMEADQIRQADYDADNRETFGSYKQGVGGVDVKMWTPGSTEVLPPPRLSDVKVARSSYQDDAEGTYTGTANALIAEPIELLRLILEELCGATVVTDGSFGDYTLTRDRLRAWYGGSSQRWKARFPMVNRANADAILKDIAGICMGLTYTRLPDGKYAFWHWAPVSLLSDDRFYGGSNAACEINVDRMVMRQSGMPQMEWGQGKAKAVINDIEISYGSNAHNLATANWELDSDDGTGQPWGYLGYMPGSTLTAFDLCDNSKRIYGARPTKRFNVPQVESRLVAQMFGMSVLARDCRPPRFLRFAGRPKVHDLRVGQVFRVSPAIHERLGCVPPFWPAGTTWDQIYWACVANTHKADSRFAVQDVSAICLPWNVGEEWSPGTGPPPTETSPAMVGGAREDDMYRDDSVLGGGPVPPPPDAP